MTTTTVVSTTSHLPSKDIVLNFSNINPINLHNSPLRQYCHYSCCSGRWQGHSVVWNWPMSREVVNGQRWSCTSVSRICSPVNCTSAVWAATGWCRSVLGLPKRYHKLSGLNNRNVFFHSSGGWLSKVKVSAGWFLLRSRRGHQFQASPGAFGGCRPSLVFLGLWTHHSDLCLHLRVAFFLCAFVS